MQQAQGLSLFKNSCQTLNNGEKRALCSYASLRTAYPMRFLANRQTSYSQQDALVKTSLKPSVGRETAVLPLRLSTSAVFHRRATAAERGLRPGTLLVALEMPRADETK
jgi:hypothetical protein